MFCRVICGQVDKVLLCDIVDMEPEGRIKLAMKALYDTLNECLEDREDLLALGRTVTLQFRDYPNIEDQYSETDTGIDLSHLLLVWEILRAKLGLRRGEMPW